MEDDIKTDLKINRL